MIGSVIAMPSSFSHPRDFTPVCTTEFGAVAQLAPEWAKRNTKVIGVSVDSVADHEKWKRDIQAFGGAPADFPIIDDSSLTVAKAYDMLAADYYLPAEGRTPAHCANGAHGVHHRAGQEGEADDELPDDSGPEFRRNSCGRWMPCGPPTACRLRHPPTGCRGSDVIVALSLNNEAAEARFGALDIKLPYLRFAKAPK